VYEFRDRFEPQLFGKNNDRFNHQSRIGVGIDIFDE